MNEEQELQGRSKSPRLFQLDALRGLAAVTVVLSHYRFAWHTTQPSWPLLFISSGSQAVVLFFVLSGYVLSLPYWNGRQAPYGIYLVRRICRIYLPFAVAAGISMVAASWFFGSRLPLSPWFGQVWQTPVTRRLVLDQLLMSPFCIFNAAFWSLRFEMQISFVMPLLCAAMLRWKAAVVTLVLGTVVYLQPDRVASLQWHYIGQTIQISFLFALGATMAKYGPQLKSVWEYMGNWQWLMLLVSLFLYYDLPYGVIPGAPAIPQTPYRDLIAAVGASGIILCSLHLKPFAGILKRPIPEYLGRISYSLYLVHSVVIFAGLNLLYGRFGASAIGAILFVVSIFAAHLFCIAVEEPCMRLGKLLTSDRTRRPSHKAIWRFLPGSTLQEERISGTRLRPTPGSLLRLPDLRKAAARPSSEDR